MRRSAMGFALGVAALSAATQAKPRLASGLRDGMRLHYSAAPGDPSTWLVGPVSPGAAGRAGADCANYVVQKGPRPSAADSIRQCISGDTLFAVNAAGALVPSRPVGPNMLIETKRQNGATMSYRTGAMSVDTIGGEAIPVVITTYTYLEVNGTPSNQLRERYAVSLGTATRGEFFVPDPAKPNQWTSSRVFRLERIEKP